MCGEKLIDSVKLAEILDVPPRTVRVWRTKEEDPGPPWAKFGRHVKYRMSDVTAWIDDRYQAAADARANRDPQ